MKIYISFILFNQGEFDLKSIIQEFLLFFKLLKKLSIQYFTMELQTFN